MRQFNVYILASRSRRLYVGVTNNVPRRVQQHRSKQCGFTARYRIFRLVYTEQGTDVMAAISREKQIKAWSRAKKLALINATNPTWDDLAADWFDEESGKADDTKADPSLRSG